MAFMRSFAIAALAITLLTACDGRKSQRSSTTVAILADARVVETKNYKILSSASDEQTRSVAKAVEALYRSYADLFGSKVHSGKFELVLYKDQAQFKANNRSKPWAEAYYLQPRCYAYLSKSENPYHWMLHEATHQLLRELSGYKPAKWINEGIASYFGTSKLQDEVLKLGAIDPNTYPIWWLSSLKLSGNIDRDIGSGKIIPLRQLITDTGPDINQNVNTYYIHYWSLSHFLFNYHNGQYANQYKSLLALGGSLDDFEMLIGPTEKIQSEWYAYLLQHTQPAGVQVTATGPYQFESALWLGQSKSPSPIGGWGEGTVEPSWFNRH